MKNLLIQTLVLSLFIQFSQAQGLLVQNGAAFKTTGTVSIVVQDGSLTNNGTTAFDSSNIYFTGTGTGTFGGTSNLSINSLYINRPSATVVLGQDVNVLSQVVLQGGLLDLNGRTLALSPAGSITGETETNRVISPAGGEITITVALNAPLGANPGNLGAILVSAANMGNVTIKRGHKPYSNVLGSNSIERYYDINPQNNSGLDAFFRFQYLDAELNGLNEANLRMYKSVNNGSTWSDQGFSGRNTTLNFVDLSSINSFSRWTLSSGAAGPLPVTLAYFKATCKGSQIVAEWQTLIELNADKFVVQRSTDGRQWENIGTLAAKGNSATAQDYKLIDINPLKNNSYYRLQQVDKDGHNNYSPVVSAGCSGRILPDFVVYPNPVKDVLKIRFVSSVVIAGALSVYDLAGQLLQTRALNLVGGINLFDLDMTNYPKGTYKLVLRIKDQKDQVEKVVKQ